MKRAWKDFVRALIGAPISSLAIVVTLGLAIAATTTIFSVVNGVLLRPLAFPEQDRLLMLWQRAPGVGVEEDWFSPAQYFDIKEQVPGFEEVALFGGRNATLTSPDADPERLGVLQVTSSFLRLLGIAPEAGRVFAERDDLEGAPSQVLLSHRFFADRFAGNRAIIGEALTLDGSSHQIAGVLPALPLDAELFPTLSTIPVFDLVLSMPMADPQQTTRGSENYNILAKVAPGVGLQQIEAELLVVASELAKDPGSLGAGLEAGSEYHVGFVRLLDQAVGPVEPPLLVLLGATLVLLLIACANVANLLLSRGAVREHELTLRSALGASRARLIVPALIESLGLAVLGGGLAMALVLVAVRGLKAVAPPQLPRLAEVGIDPRVLAFAGAACLLSSLAFGLGPALRVTHQLRPANSLRGSATGARASSAWRGGARSLVVLQVALSLILTVGAGLLVRTLTKLQQVDPGFRAEQTLSLRLSLVGERYQEPEQRVRFYQQLWPLLEAIPGVERAGGTSLLPLTRGFAWTDFLVEGFNAEGEENRVVADLMIATPGYFDAMGSRLVAGRDFDRTDRASLEAESGAGFVIVNRAFAERFWPLESAIGKWVQTDFSEQSQIVGVVETIKHYGADAETRLAVFFPHSAFGSRTLFGVLRASTDPLALAPAVSDVVKRLDPALAVYDIRAMTDRVRDSFAERQAVMMMLILFSAAAVLLATVGLYGVLSFTVASHTREIGIRAALGAQKADLYRLVLRGAGMVALPGVLLGSFGAAAASRAFGSMIYGVAAFDPPSYLGSIGLILAVSLLASWLPARRAAAVDPAVVLAAN